MKRLFLTVLLIVSVLVFMSEGMSAFAEPVVLKNSETGKGVEDEEKTDPDLQQPDRSLQNGTLIYGMTPVYPGDFKDGTYKTDVISSSQFFKITDAELTKKNNKIKAVITLSSTSYAYIYPGTAAEAAADKNNWIAADESTGYGRFVIDVPALNREMPCAAYSKKKQKWYDRDIVFIASSLPEDSLMIELSDEGGTIIDTQEAALKVIYIAIAIIVAGGIINHFVKKKYYE